MLELIEKKKSERQGPPKPYRGIFFLKTAANEKDPSFSCKPLLYHINNPVMTQLTVKNRMWKASNWNWVYDWLLVNLSNCQIDQSCLITNNISNWPWRKKIAWKKWFTNQTQHHSNPFSFHTAFDLQLAVHLAWLSTSAFDGEPPSFHFSSVTLTLSLREQPAAQNTLPLRSPLH